VPVVRKIRLGEHVSIRELSAQTGLKSSDIIGFLMKELEILATINQVVDQEISALILDHFAFEYEMKKIVEIEDVLKHVEDRPEDLMPRAPVVTVLGHVDHGKTKLLDAIRGTDVVATEAGGITQRIGAFMVNAPAPGGGTRPVTFIDTPGHAAFTAMRARGAMVTDIAVLVVAANDGVMPQTLEAIDHARSAGVEIIVAINKIDLPDANVERVKQQLSELGLVPEQWGGQVIMVPISAKKKIGIEDLLENIHTVADILELKGNPGAQSEGYVIEARLDRGRGALATVIMQRGTLDIGDYVVAGRSWGRVRQMTDEDGNAVEKAGPSLPVLISGLNTVPQAGDKLNQVEDEKTGREIYEKREMEHRQGRLRMVNTISLEDFYEKMSKGEMKELNIILKADLQGSIEALRGQLEQLSTDEVGVRFIHTAVGNITDSDIMLAMASKAIILGFNVVASPEIRKQAAMEGVDIRTYNIIYKAVEDIQAALEGLLEPEYQEHELGRAEIKQVFKKTSRMIVAGAYVEEGKLVRGSDLRVLRDGAELAKVELSSLKRFKDDVKEVEVGQECGIMLDGYNDLKEGDTIVAFETVKVLRTLSASKAEQ
jgi:translation initiation factor IF-2